MDRDTRVREKIKYMKGKKGRAPREEIKGSLKCSRCNKWLPKIEFRKDRTHVIGFMSYCKDCCSQTANKEKAKKRNKEFYNKQEADFWKKYRKRHLKKIKVRELANYYYKQKAICSVKGCSEIGEKHHHDYNKPLDIIWLCRKHHALLERKGR